MSRGDHHSHAHGHAHAHGDHAHDAAHEHEPHGPDAHGSRDAHPHAKPGSPDAHDHASHGFGHGHHHHHAGEALAWALWLNVGFLLVEVIIGVLSGSIAVLSDAGHMIADVAALAIAWVAQRLSRVRGSSAYTFGLRRLPILGGLANALTLNGIVVLIVVVAIQRLREPTQVESFPVLVAGVVGLFVNAAAAWILHRRGGHGVNVRGAMLHLFADALGSVGVIVSGVVLTTTGWTAIDPVISLVIAGLIGIGTWPLVRDLVRTLLLGTPAQIDTDQVRAVFLEDAEVRCLEDFHLWEVDTDYVVLSARVHTNVRSLESADELVKRISARLRREFRIHHVTIEVGPHTEGSHHGENDCLGAA